jgi:Cu(I)/Ag(I) efflux system membrane protein CusA/SilA
MINGVIKFFLDNKLAAMLLLLLFIGWGLVTAPFDWRIDWLPRDPAPVDAIPDIGENQQILFTEWMGRSPQDVEDQITYPLTTALLGMPGVKSIRSTSMFGFSSIYIIFEDHIEYYWSRSRILEKLNALPAGLLPEGLQPQLGPDATALGQVYWYTLEGRDEEGRPAGGWDPHELRSVQDYYVRYALAAAEGVAEVASVGGHVKEYQVDLDPAAMQAHNVSMMEVMEAVRNSNLDVGANTLEINLVEYLVRGLGYVKKLEDIEEAVVAVRDNVPLRIRDIAKVNIGPATRVERGILDKDGAEAVGGVVVARYGDNPLAVIQRVKEKIEEIAPGLPARTLDDGTVSKVTIVPFYDRTQLINETLGTLYEAINLQILITIIVIVLMISNLRASLLISALLPAAVLMCFIFMKYLRVDANIVALSGIAIAIGTMVDLGIILCENLQRHWEEAPPGKPKDAIIYEAAAEVASAIVTAVSTTIISFLPVFTLQAAEGKLFGPLAYTKTFALVAALIFTIVIMPVLAYWVFGSHIQRRKGSILGLAWPFVAGLPLAIVGYYPLGAALVAYGVSGLLAWWRPGLWAPYHSVARVAIAAGLVSWLLAEQWLPLGPSNSVLLNFIFILLLIGLVLGGFGFFIRLYPRLLAWCLEHKGAFILLPALLILLGASVWMGFPRVFSPLAYGLDYLGIDARQSRPWQKMAKTFPGMGKEFMPALDEGAFLLMPTTMPHAGVEANHEMLRRLDMLVAAIPEVELVVGKAGRAETALDPAPMSMFENVILYKSEYRTDANGRRLRFRVDENRAFSRDARGELIPDARGEYFRQWRDHIRSPDDIWQEITQAAQLPGLTSAPKLQPIETRLVMLQTGMRAPMGIKVYGPDLATIEYFSLRLERYLKEVPSVKAEAVFADRSLGKPYLEIELNRRAMGRYGLNVAEVQLYLEMALGGMTLSTTVEGRERYNIRARYAREYRDDPEQISAILIPTMSGQQIPLGQIAEVIYRPGPMMIRGEDAFLVGYVLLDKRPGFAEVSVVENARDYLRQKIASGELRVPPGVRYQFSGSYENQVRAEKRLAIVVPLCLLVIFMILYFQFRSVATSLFIFTAIAMAFSGGFLMLWLYGQSWFLDFSLFGTPMRDLFQIHQVNLSVAVWVGFIALFGIATDDGVLMATYLRQSFEAHQPENRAEVRRAVTEAGMKRVRPCLMTTATTLLALLPVLTSSGRGADIMIPMAIPAFGGMSVALISLFIVPVLYSWWRESKIKQR